MANDLVKVPQQSAAQVQAVAAAEEIKCLFLASAQFPRDSQDCLNQILNACTDMALAEEALFSYRKGGSLIEGASIDLIDEIATIWGRINSGWIVIDTQPGMSQVMAFAMDVQTLKRDSRTFWVDHKGAKGNVLTDSRDIYEMIANMSQRRKRSCIESVLPKYVINAAVNQVKETLANKDQRPMSQRMAEMSDYFYNSFGVTKAQIEKKIGSKLEAISNTQVVALRAIAKTLRDGGKVADYFDVTIGVPEAEDPNPPQHIKEVIATVVEDVKPGKSKNKKNQAAVPKDSIVAQAPASTSQSSEIGSQAAAATVAATSSSTSTPGEDLDWSKEFG